MPSSSRAGRQWVDLRKAQALSVSTRSMSVVVNGRVDVAEPGDAAPIGAGGPPQGAPAVAARDRQQLPQSPQ